MLSARKAVQSLPTYHPPLSSRAGLRMDFNENTLGCSPRVAEKLYAISRDALARYPERGSVEAQVASFLGRSADEVLLVVPTFAMYEIYARATGATILSIPAENNFAFPTAAVLAAISSRTRLIAIANPNNPTGTAVAADVLLQIAEAAPQAALLVDEAYFEFHGQTLLAHIGMVANLFVA